MIVFTVFTLIILLFSIIIHEIAHGSVALSLGDPTAKSEGRLTLNPLKHIDPFGSVILPLLLFISGSSFLIGWAKPVPVNPYNFRNQKWGTLKVSLAGPATNFIIAIIFGLIVRFVNIPQVATFIEFLSIIIFLNLLLGIFNLVPIPPLDGSWVLFRFLPEGWVKAKMFLQQYGLFILILFIFFGSVPLIGMVRLLYQLVTDTPSPF